ncbi:MAG: restriction endonuclease subunit M [Clostridia bacterium]|nr:restriction endonuclease subunit M [Clostridia bacterium]
MLTKLIQMDEFPVRPVLPILLQDKTTKKNIIWATGSYAALGEQYAADVQMTTLALVGMDRVLLQPRVLKALSEQQERTKAHAEVFTPSWVCNQMNNFCDEEWFGRKDVFNSQEGHAWTATEELIAFSENKTWKHYVDSRRLEITCGEAPFLVSRYDAATGEEIPIPQRIGQLDRKLRVVNENAADEDEWLKWTLRAFQSVYGYEYQGDNLIIARINLLMTFVEYLEDRWKRQPTIEELKKVANVISWNLWQMDGLKGTVPLGEPEDLNQQVSMFDLFGSEMGFETDAPKAKKTPRCRVFDWRTNESLPFDNVGKESLER